MNSNWIQLRARFATQNVGSGRFSFLKEDNDDLTVDLNLLYSVRLPSLTFSAIRCKLGNVVV